MRKPASAPSRGEWRRRHAKTPSPEASDSPAGCVRKFPGLARATGMLRRRCGPELDRPAPHTQPAGLLLRAACDETPPSFPPVHGLPKLRDRSRQVCEPLRHRDLGNRGGRGSWFRNRSESVAVPVFADRQRGIGSTAKVFALREESLCKLGVREEWLRREWRRRHDLSNEPPRRPSVCPIRMSNDYLRRFGTSVPPNFNHQR